MDACSERQEGALETMLPPFRFLCARRDPFGKQASKQGNEQRVTNIRIVPSLIKDAEKNALVFSEIVLICSDSRQSRVIEAVRHFGECSRAGLAVHRAASGSSVATTQTSLVDPEQQLHHLRRRFRSARRFFWRRASSSSPVLWDLQYR